MIQYDKPARANFASHPLVQRTKKLDADSQQSKQQSRKATNASGQVLPQPSLNQPSLNQLSTLSSSTQFENQPLQNNTDSNPEVSASRVIWNALAIASMVTLIGFGLLSLKLSNDLNQAQANLNAIQGPLTADGSVSTVQYNERGAAQQQLLEDQNQYTALQAKYQSIQEENNRFAQLNASLVEESSRIEKLLSIEQQRIALVGAANQVVILFGTEATPSLQGTLYMKDYRGLLVVHGLEVLAPDQAYQLWLFTESGLQVPAGLITAQDNHDPIWTEIEISPNMPDFIAASISIEPANGSISPTGPMVLSSKINS